MDELHMCHYCGQPLEDLSQLHDITHCAKYAIETSIPTLQQRVEELEMSIKEAVKEIEDSMQSADWEVASVYDGALLILKNHGLVEDK